MAVLTYAGITDAIQKELVVDTSTDAPINAATLLEAVNSAYAQVWEISGGSIKHVGSPNAWTSESSAVGMCYGILTDVKEVLHIYASTVAPVTVAGCTVSATAVLVTSTAGFGSVVRGMQVTGTRISANSFVTVVTDSSNLNMNQYGATPGSDTLTFTDTGEATGAKEMERVDFSRIQWLKKSGLVGSYGVPKCYSVTRVEPGTPAAAAVGDVGKLRLDYWPAVTGFYFPMVYLPMFTPMDGGSADCPSVNDLESYDIAYLAAMSLAPRVGRSELVPALAMKVSETTRRALERKIATLVSGDQDK